MKTKQIFVALILTGSNFLSACSHFDSFREIQAKLDSRQDNCPPDRVCTAVFAIISASVKYPDNTPVVLDTYKVIQTATGADKTPKLSPTASEAMRQSGTYPVTTDEYQKEWVGQKVELEFIGYKDGKEPVKRKFTVSADCCHVTLLEGERQIILEK